MALLPERFEFPIRPADKEQVRYHPSAGLGDHFPGLFEQYIEDALFTPGGNTLCAIGSDDSSSVFDLATSSGASDGADLSADARHRHGSASAGRHALEQTPTSPHVETSTGADKAAAFEVDLLSLDDFCVGPVPSPLSGFAISPPPSPTPELSVSKRRFALPVRTSNGARSPIRKQQRKSSQSPKMLSPRHQRASHNGTWAKKLEAATEKLSIHASAQTPLSPRSSGTLAQSPRSGTFVPPNFQGFDVATPGYQNHDHTASSMRNGAAQFPPQSQAALTPLASPTYPSQSHHRQHPQPAHHPMAFNPAHLQREQKGVLHTPPQSHKLESEAWISEPQEWLDYAYSASPGHCTPQRAEAWWNTAGGMHQQPLMGLGIEGINPHTMAINGVAHQYELSPAAFDALMQSSPDMQCGPFTSPNPLVAAPPSSTSITPSTTYMTSRVSTPSPSPATATRASQNSKSLRGHSRPGRHHQRSQSQQNPAPPRRRSSKDLSSPTTTPKRAGARPVSAGFVNFTPDDSRRILTGVAPSGSSKTKARREKEAAEKRRKLSEAARRAVLEAGGDVERLEREGLLTGLMGQES